MKPGSQLLSCVLFLALSASASAEATGTRLVVTTPEGETTVLTDGKKSRIEMGGGEYVISDFQQKTLKVVSPARHEVMLLTIPDAKKPASSSVRLQLQEQGAGESIAGYKTRKYSYSANGKTCGQVLASKEAYSEEGIREIFQGMRAMMQSQRDMMGGFTGMMQPCDLAAMQFPDHIERIGMPMRTISGGIMDSEVKSIQTGVTLPADTFSIPAGYRTVSMDQKMQEARQQMQQMAPEMQQMMQQMQQSGKMTPEMQKQLQEQMRLMQQMYQQQ